MSVRKFTYLKGKKVGGCRFVYGPAREVGFGNVKVSPSSVYIKTRSLYYVCTVEVKHVCV